MQAKVNEELAKCFEKHNISTENVEFRFELGLNRRGPMQTDVPGTDRKYNSYLSQLYKFLAISGEWESMMLLCFPTRTDESVKCPAMQKEALCMN